MEDNSYESTQKDLEVQSVNPQPVTQEIHTLDIKQKRQKY